MPAHPPSAEHHLTCQYHHAQSHALSVKERIDKYGLKPDRADVIIPAAEIFLNVAQALGCTEIHVPNISLADGIIDGMYKEELRS